MSKPSTREVALHIAAPTQRLLTAQKCTYEEAFRPNHTHFRVKDVAQTLLSMSPDQFPTFETEVQDLQQQIRRFTSHPAKNTEDEERELLQLIRKDSSQDSGRQYLLETIVAGVCGLPSLKYLPVGTSPELLALRNVMRERLLQNVRRGKKNTPFIDSAVVEINGLEANLELGEATFSQRFAYYQEATKTIASLLLNDEGFSRTQENIYAALKGAVSSHLVARTLSHYLPSHTTLYPPLIEIDRDMGIDGLGLNNLSDCVVLTTQAKSSAATLDRTTPFLVHGAGQQLNLTSHIKTLSYRNTPAGAIHLFPILIAHPSPQGPVLSLCQMPVYQAAFSPDGQWTNPVKTTLKDYRVRMLGLRHTTEQSWQLWQGAHPYIPTNPDSMGVMLGIVSFGPLESWHSQQNHTRDEKMKHLIRLAYQ